MRKALVASSLLSCVALAGCREKAPEPNAAPGPTVNVSAAIGDRIASARVATAASKTIVITAVSETNANGKTGRTTQTANIDRVAKSQAIHVSLDVPDELGLVAPDYDFITVGGQTFLGPLRRAGTYLEGDANELGAGRKLISIKSMFNTIDVTTWAAGQGRAAADGTSLECFYAFLKDDVDAPNLNPTYAKAAAKAATGSTVTLSRSTAEVCVSPAGKLAHLGFEAKSQIGSELIGVEITTDAAVAVARPENVDPNPEKVLKRLRKAAARK